MYVIKAGSPIVLGEPWGARKRPVDVFLRGKAYLSVFFPQRRGSLSEAVRRPLGFAVRARQ